MQEQFENYGKVERVKKIKDYAFVHFEDRDSAVIAMKALNGKEVGAANIEVNNAEILPINKLTATELELCELYNMNI